MARDPDVLLDRAGVSGDPRADQHFLIDDRVLDRMPGYLTEIHPQPDTILEIGPGTGALTDRLLGVTDQVVAIERDQQLAAFLRREFESETADGRLRVETDDALTASLPRFDACVSNLPYSATSDLLFRLMPRREPIVVTLQKEVGDRLTASPGTSDYGRLSVTAGYYAAAEIVETVPPTAFQPVPAVDSVIVRFRPRDPEYTLPDEDFFFAFLKAVFTQRRKTLRNAIRNTTHISGIGDAQAVLAAIADDWLDRRPATFSPAEYAAMARTAAEADDV